MTENTAPETVSVPREAMREAAIVMAGLKGSWQYTSVRDGWMKGDAAKAFAQLLEAAGMTEYEAAQAAFARQDAHTKKLEEERVAARDARRAEKAEKKSR